MIIEENIDIDANASFRALYFGQVIIPPSALELGRLVTLRKKTGTTLRYTMEEISEP